LQRDNLFYPSWAFALPTLILQTPQALLESVLWSSIVYWVAGLAPEAGRCATLLVEIIFFPTSASKPAADDLVHPLFHVHAKLSDQLQIHMSCVCALWQHCAAATVNA
jgi:hypothetical protein